MTAQVKDAFLLDGNDWLVIAASVPTLFDPGSAFTTPLFDHYNAAEDDDAKVTALKNVILALLQSQYYQVC